MAGNIQNTRRKFMRENTCNENPLRHWACRSLDGCIHVMMRVITPFSMSLEYENVVANYQNILYSLLLESILILVSIHGFNGLRVMLLN